MPDQPFVSPEQVGQMIELARQLHTNGDAQLSLLGSSFIIACKALDVPEDRAIQILRKHWKHLQVRQPHTH